MKGFIVDIVGSVPTGRKG